MFNNYQSIIDNVSKINTINELNRKMLSIDSNKNKLNYNTNLKLQPKCRTCKRNNSCNGCTWCMKCVKKE